MIWRCLKCNYFTSTASRLEQHDVMKHRPYNDPILEEEEE